MFWLALKNIRYYKARSLTTFFLTFLTALLFIVYVAFMDGSHASMLKNALKVYTGSLQIYQKNYRDEGSYDNLIYDARKVEGILEQTPGLAAYTARLETFGIASSKEYSSAIMLTGIDFAKEAKISELKTALTEGIYASRGHCLYLGSGLAKRLRVGIGDEVSFIGSAIDSAFVAELFRVCGTFKTGMHDFDLQSAFLNRETFDTIFDSQNCATYLVAAAQNLEENDRIAASIATKLPPDLRVYTWKELMKSMVELMKVDSIFGYVSMGLFFLVIFFVIMIYSFINVSVRIREFGTLKSIGLGDQAIDRLLFYEIFILSTLALALATPIGSGLAYYFELHPLVIEGMSETYKEYGIITDEVPTLFDAFTVAWNVALIYALNMLSILYPIRYVRKFTPIQAMQHV